MLRFYTHRTVPNRIPVAIMPAHTVSGVGDCVEKMLSDLKNNFQALSENGSSAGVLSIAFQLYEQEMPFSDHLRGSFAFDGPSAHTHL